MCPCCGGASNSVLDGKNHSLLLGRCNMRLNSNCARTYTAALLVGALLLGAPAAAKGRTAETRSATGVVDVSTIQIDNFGSVNPMYFRGAQPEGHDYADVAALGVKTIINLT